MSVPAAYLTVILIWSTTPLAIQWSGIGVGYEFGVAARMTISLLALLLIVRFRRLPLPWNSHARRVYTVSGLSIFIAMSLVYWSAQYIPSGWISVVFGLSPIITSAFATVILRENNLTAGRIAGMLLGLCGLFVVFAEGFSLAGAAWMGVAGITIGTTSQSLGAVLLQKLKTDLPAISITAGSLVVATPLFLLNFAVQQDWPDTIGTTTALSIVYLAILGSAIGFPLYFYLLKNLSAERVALIALITPVTALLVGAALNDEIISTRVWLGTALIITGLAIYEYGKHLPFARKWQKRWNQRPL
ncbi:MAG: DMT family transporter [Gammaproteobacteria bacterium]|nr:DMT family transporter [Gammaproteobacteria bacterium]